MKPIQFFFQASAHQGRQQFKCLCKFPASSNATLPWSSPSVHFFSTAAAGEKEAMNIGKFYQDLLYRGRKDNLVSIKELKKLLKMCQSSEDVKYAGLAIDWFQEKGFDFNEELNSLFIKKCLEGNQPDAVVKRFLYRKGRIGSWCTPSSIHRLLSALQEQQDHQAIIQLIQVLTPKGVQPDLKSFEIVFQAATDPSVASSYEEMAKIAQRLLPTEDFQTLTQKYPAPPAAAAEAPATTA